MSTLSITHDMTVGELSRMVARIYKEVKRPGEDKIILESELGVNGIILSKELPNSFTLTRKGQITMKVVTIQLQERAFAQFKHIFDAVKIGDRNQYIGEHQIDMLPVKVVLPVVHR